MGQRRRTAVLSNALDGRLCWQRRGGPADEYVLGNDRVVARWPVRGGPVVRGRAVYFGAGIWPSEGIYLYGLDADSGHVLWNNDSAGSLELDQPHPGAHARSGVSAQGHLAINGEDLLVPTGRAVPAVFDLGSGEFRYFRLQANRGLGGSEVSAVDRYFVNSMTLFAAESGKVVGSLRRSRTRRVAVWSPTSSPVKSRSIPSGSSQREGIAWSPGSA